MLTQAPPCASPGILIQCRPGFEGDAALEVMAQADNLSLSGQVETNPNGGTVFFRLDAPMPWDALRRRFDAARLMFARQSCYLIAELNEFPDRDRLTPILSALRAHAQPCSVVLMETPDTNAGKQQSGFLGRFGPILERALKDEGLLHPDSPHLPRLHLFLADARQVHLGLSGHCDASPWPMGIPRLRMPKDAPSRSTLKLAEAFQTLLDADEARRILRAGLTAVDLGAAPGGWSWQLASRGIRVTAIDNGPLAPAALATGLIDHLKADGFTWRPKKPVDWLVCDMVEQPARIAALMADWLVAKHCRQAIFNLKLPMKKRFAEVERCRALIDQHVRSAGIKYALKIKHLYHDREEVTCYLTRR